MHGIKTSLRCCRGYLRQYGTYLIASLWIWTFIHLLFEFIPSWQEDLVKDIQNTIQKYWETRDYTNASTCSSPLRPIRWFHGEIALTIYRFPRHFVEGIIRIFPADSSFSVLSCTTERMERCKEFHVEEGKEGVLNDILWYPGVSSLLGIEKMHKMVGKESEKIKEEIPFEYVPPLFIPQAISLELGPNASINVNIVESTLFRRRSTFVDSITNPNDTQLENTSLTPQEETLQNPTSLFSIGPAHLQVEEDVYVSQNILLSLLLGSTLTDSNRVIIQDVFLTHAKLLLEAFIRRLDKHIPLNGLSHLVFASLYGGLVALLESKDTIYASRIVLECLPILQSVNTALDPIAQSLAHADRLDFSPGRYAINKRIAEDIPSIVSGRIPLKRQRTIYREPEVHLHFAQAIKIMLDNVHGAITGTSTDLINPTNLLNWEKSDSTSTSLMAYFDLSFQAANELVRISKRNSFSSVLVFVAENPTQLPLIQVEVEMDCIKTSLSLLFEIQMTISNVQRQEEPVQILHADVQQKLMRWKGAMAVLLSLGWTVNTTGWYHLEYLAGAPQKLNEASQLLSKYILLCKNRLQHLHQTHQVLLLQTNEAASMSKQLPIRFDYHCPLTHHIFTSPVELTRHANNIEPWLKCSVYCKMKKRFWYSPYSSQPQGNLHFPSYISCRLEVQVSSELLWIRHPYYLYHKCLSNMISNPQSEYSTETVLYVLPQCQGDVHFAAAAVYPSEMVVIHSLVPFVPEDHETTWPQNSFLHDLIKGNDTTWGKRLSIFVPCKSLERAQLERKIVGLVLVVSGLLPFAVSDVDHASWVRLKRELQHFRMWLHQQSQISANTLENLGHWVTFLLQILNGPDAQLWSTSPAHDYLIHQVLEFLKRVCTTKLTLNLQHKLTMLRRSAWFQVIGLVVLSKHLEKCPALPTCQMIAIDSIDKLFHSRDGNMIQYGKHWNEILMATHSWAGECDEWNRESLHRLWRQPGPKNSILLNRPEVQGALSKIFQGDTISQEAWSTALFLTLDCLQTQTFSIVELYVNQFQWWLLHGNDESILRGHRLLSLLLSKIQNPNESIQSSISLLCIQLCENLHKFSPTTQEHIVHGFQVLLPLIPANTIVFNFIALLVAVNQDPFIGPCEPHLIDRQVVLQPTCIYSATISSLALIAMRFIITPWSMTSVLESWIPATTNAQDSISYLKGISSLMLLSKYCPKLVVGHSLGINRKDLCPVKQGILLSYSRDNNMTANCRCLFESTSNQVDFYIITCTEGLLSFDCNHAHDIKLPESIITLIETSKTSSPTAVSNWLFQLYLDQLEDNSSLGGSMTELMDIALQNLHHPRHSPPFLSPDTAIQPLTFWRVEETYRYVLHQLGRLHDITEIHQGYKVLSGYNPPPSYRNVFQTSARVHHTTNTTLEPSSVLSHDQLKKIAALECGTNNPADLAQLLDMGFSANLSAYVLKYYPHNVQGACNWLMEETNADDMRRITVLQPRVIEYGSPFTKFYRLNSDVKESLLMSCSASREMISVFQMVPRECFVPSLYEKEVENDSTITHPLGYTLPSMYQCLQVLSALDLKPGLSILDIGTGSGYFVTLLARLMNDTATITSWEQDSDRLAYAYIYMAQSVQDGHNVIYPKFMESIQFQVCNAFLNNQKEMTFDRVHVGASCPRECVDLLLQYVALRGLLVVPIDGTLYRIHKTHNTNDWRELNVEPLGSYSIESLTAPSLQVLATDTNHGLHGFEEQLQPSTPRVLELEEEVALTQYSYPIEPGMLFKVKPSGNSKEFQQGRSETGYVATRVGSIPVRLRELSMGVKISDASLRVSNRGSFGTACANVCVRGGGVWFYEVRIGTSKVIQIGWILPGFDPNPESGLGVGDDLFSYAYDGRRKKKWHNGVSDDYCKQPCKAGDVVGCLLDLDKGHMSFLLNGTQLEIAYSNIPRDFLVGGFTPACSMDGGESVWFNFGSKPFLYPPTQSFCPLAEFNYPSLQLLPSSPCTIYVAKKINSDSVTATTLDQLSQGVRIPMDRIVPLDHEISAFLRPHGRSLQDMCSDLHHDLRISMVRRFLARYQFEMKPSDLANYLSCTSEYPELSSKTLDITRVEVPWLIDSMERQLANASKNLIVEESRHPISHRLLNLTPTMIHVLKTLRTNLLDMEASMEKGHSRTAMVHLQRATEAILNRTERESGDHFLRCRSQLETTYQRIRSASSDYTFPDPPNYDRRPTLEKVFHLKQALELFEAQVSFPSRVPVDSIEGKYVGLSDALSLKIEFDPRTIRTNWKLLFFADAACAQRWPWVLSRDGFHPFIIPANHFYYSFIPDTSKTHFVPEWGYCFRVTPYVFQPEKFQFGWSTWNIVLENPSLQDALIHSYQAEAWLHQILNYIRTPAAPYKIDVLSTLIHCIHRHRTNLHQDIQSILSHFMWYLLPELNSLYRQSIKWKLHSNPYFQTLLQLMTTLSTVVPKRIQRYAMDSFGYHADMHTWHQDLIETVEGLNHMEPSVWQPIIAKQFNPLNMLKQLIKQFEASIKSDVQKWHKNRRELWIRQVDQAYHPALLSNCLCIFNETLLPGSRECGWTSERNKWLRHLFAACTVGDIAMQLMVLAGFIDVDSHSSSWSCQSYDWRKAVMSLARTDLSEDCQLRVSGRWTDGNVVLDNEGGPAIDRMFEDSTKLFRVRQYENVHVIGSFEFKRSLIRKMQFRLRKTYTNNNTPCTAGLIFVFPDYPTPEDMMKIQQYDYFTSTQYQSYVSNMRRQGIVPLPGDPIGFFDVTSPHYCQGNAVTIVPDFAILGQFVVIKLLRCYNICAMEELADVIKRHEEHTPDIYFNMNPVYLWCYKPYEEWLMYPSDVEYMIESKYQAYCSGDIVCHGEFVVSGLDVVIDFQQMMQYMPSDQYSSPTTCRIKRVLVSVDMKIKLRSHHCMEVEYMGFYGLQEAAAEEAYNKWKTKFSTVCYQAQNSIVNHPPTELYRVLSEKSPVYSFPCLNAPVSTYVLYGEIVSITKRMGRWGCIAKTEAWCLLDSHQPSFFPVSHARAAAHGAVPWLLDQAVFCVAPNGETYPGVLQASAPREVDEELVHVVNKLRETSGRCVANLAASETYTFAHGKHKDYPYLSIFPIPEITGRLDLLRSINLRISQCLMFLGISLKQKQTDWLSGIVIQAKGCLFLETKMHVWKKIWTESYSNERSSEVVSINRHIAFKAREMLRDSMYQLNDISIYYSTVFVQLWNELQRTPRGLLRRSDGKSWFTKFKGEPSIDDGGLYRETTATTCYELNNGLLPLFVPCSNGKHSQGINQNTLVPNTSSIKWYECCEWFEFVGVLIGIATQNLEEVFPLQLATPIWKLLVSEQLTLNDFYSFDIATIQTLKYLRTTHFDDDEMFDAIFPQQTFTCMNEQDELIELIPNGKNISVTLKNRLEYADALEYYRLHQFDPIVSYISKGLASIIHIDLLPMFTWIEFELLVCGRSTLNLALLRKKTEYSPDMDMHDTLVERFWRTLASFTQDEQQLFLQFVWGRSRLPFSEVDFGSYTFKLVRHMSPSNPDDYLPVAHTCFFQLELPNYSSDEIMRTKLLYAMNHCTSIVDEEQAAQQRDMALWES